jgi:hypothetical protein
MEQAMGSFEGFMDALDDSVVIRLVTDDANDVADVRYRGFDDGRLTGIQAGSEELVQQWQHDGAGENDGDEDSSCARGASQELSDEALGDGPRGSITYDC